MTSKRTHVASPGPARRFARGLLVACCLSWLLPATCRRGEVTPYQATVPLAGATEATAPPHLARRSRSRSCARRGAPRLRRRRACVAAAADPSSYVQQYSTTADRMLKVGFRRARHGAAAAAGGPADRGRRNARGHRVPVHAVGRRRRARRHGRRSRARTTRRRTRGAAARRAGDLADRDARSAQPARARLGAERAALLGLGAGGSYEWVVRPCGADCTRRRAARCRRRRRRRCARGTLRAGVDRGRSARCSCASAGWRACATMRP